MFGNMFIKGRMISNENRKAYCSNIVYGWKDRLSLRMTLHSAGTVTIIEM